MANIVVNQNYWKRRIEELRKIRLQIEKGLNATLIQEYSKLAKNLITDIEAITYEITNTEGVIIPSDIYKANRQIDFFNHIKKELTELNTTQSDILKKSFTKLYNITGTACAETLGRPYTPDEALIKNCINAIWCNDGKNWSRRIHENSEQLANTLYNNFLKSIQTGESVKKIPELIKNECGIGLYEATRLVRTELTHIQNTSAMDRYSEAGVTRFKIISFADEKRCPICNSQSGQIYRMDNYTEGETAPPFHPNCRCAIIPLDEPLYEGDK